MLYYIPRFPASKKGRVANMKRPKILQTALFLLCFTFLAVTQGIAQAATPEARIADSAKILREMAKQNDASTMADLIRDAKGIAIFPSVVKAGFVLGGRYGEGLLLKRDPQSGNWYGPNFLTIAGASWGIQIGIQSTALVLVITNDRGMQGFMGDNVTLGGDLAVAAGPVGRSAQAATDSRLKASIYSYSMSKGLFAGLSLEGAVVDTDQDANKAYWKKEMSPQQILARRATDQRMAPLTREIANILKKK